MELTSFAVLTALTIGVVEAIKRTKILPRKYIPLLAVIAGLLLTSTAGAFNLSHLTILEGIAVGLSAVGLYNQKKIAE